MFFYFTPPEIFQKNFHIIVGANGSGKSTFLKRLCEDYIQNKRKVVAIAPSLYDKFQGIKSNNFHFFGGRQGKTAVKNSIIELFKKVNSGDLKLLRHVSSTLEYMGYDGCIGINIIGLKNDRKVDRTDVVTRDTIDIDVLNAALYRAGFINNKNTVWLGLKGNSYDEIANIVQTKIIPHEKFLKKLGIISDIKLYLRKQGESIPILEASSGELTLIASIIHLCTHIEYGSAILIDEPETSLHPQWQKEYLPRLLDLFYYWEPTIVIATHSPIIVSGAEYDNYSKGKIQFHNIVNGEARELPAKAAEGIEEVMWEKFKVLTPSNNFLSDTAIDLLNNLVEKKITLSTYNKALSQFKKSSYDDKQKEAIEKLIEAGKTLTENS